MKIFENKTVLITGGTRGIGLMMARGLLQAGARVVISSRKADACNAAAERLSEIGPCISIPADLSTKAGSDRLAAEIAEREKNQNAARLKVAQDLYKRLADAEADYSQTVKTYGETIVKAWPFQLPGLIVPA